MLHSFREEQARWLSGVLLDACEKAGYEIVVTTTNGVRQSFREAADRLTSQARTAHASARQSFLDTVARELYVGWLVKGDSDVLKQAHAAYLDAQVLWEERERQRERG